ncbi:MAG: tetratricopeptide repeat protein [Deltaproteobacteria bacterium]|nr:tetratricopeptide repeat protein [Deltaproteobacteria bacterium]
MNKENAKFIRETLDAKARADTGHHTDAARILWELLVQVRHIRDRHWECMTMVHMGKVYRSLRWHIAVQLLEDAIELAKEIGFDTAKMMALVELGEIKCQWGQFAESLALFEEAFKLLPEGDLEARRSVLLDMTISYEGLNNFKKCEELLSEVIEIDRQIKCEDIQEDLDHLERIRTVESP